MGAVDPVTVVWIVCNGLFLLSSIVPLIVIFQRFQAVKSQWQSPNKWLLVPRYAFIVLSVVLLTVLQILAIAHHLHMHDATDTSDLRHVCVIIATQTYLFQKYFLLLSFFCQFYAIFQSTPLAAKQCSIRIFMLVFITLPLCNILHPFMLAIDLHHNHAIGTGLLSVYFLVIWLTMISIISLNISKLKQAHSMDKQDQTLIDALNKTGLLGVLSIVVNTVCPIAVIVSYQPYLQHPLALYVRVFAVMLDVYLTLIITVLSDTIFDAEYKNCCTFNEQLCCETNARLASSSLDSVFAEQRVPDIASNSMFMEVSSKRNTMTARIAAYRPSVTPIAVNDTSPTNTGIANTKDTPRSELDLNSYDYGNQHREISVTASQATPTPTVNLQSGEIETIKVANGGGRLMALDIIQEQQQEDANEMDLDGDDDKIGGLFQIQMAECNDMVTTDEVTPQSVGNHLTLQHEVRSESPPEMDDEL